MTIQQDVKINTPHFTTDSTLDLFLNLTMIKFLKNNSSLGSHSVPPRLIPHTSHWCNLTVQGLTFTVSFPNSTPCFSSSALSEPPLRWWFTELWVLIYKSHCFFLKIQERDRQPVWTWTLPFISWGFHNLFTLPMPQFPHLGYGGSGAATPTYGFCAN